MADQPDSNPTASDHDTASPQPGSGPSHEDILVANLPPQETRQPDPVLQLSVGRLGAGSITLVAILAVIILSVVFYGLNSPAPNAQDVGTPASTASAPAAGGGSNAPNNPQQPHSGGG